jgi:predicted nuclease of predicted toxin-antitoxin system
LRFLLDNDVDYGVAVVLRSSGHDVVTAHEVGLAGVESAEDDELTVYASDTGRVVVTHDREFTTRRKRHTLGLHVRLRVEQPYAAQVLEQRLDELVDALTWNEHAVVEVFRTKVRHHPPCWE